MNRWRARLALGVMLACAAPTSGIAMQYYGPWGYDWPFYYPPYYYPSYYYPPYAYAPPYTVTYIEQQDPAWHYCAALDAYYPYVTQCPDGAWSRVSPQPAPGSDNRGPAANAPGR